ncbi:MAG: ATP synthase F1 subunit delta [Alphaproteobacteria bacterium]|nr:ATP synthase F1 subunit delta [Alphaproteobacteria bacterium]MDD9919141.1 ATP synthase F1 subunit delta [Alphaproteobacteria bacterium]
MSVLTKGPERRYATALFELAQQQKKRADVEASMAVLAKALEEAPVLASYLKNKVVSVADKTQAIQDILKTAKAPELVAKFIRFVGCEGRLSLLPEIVRAFGEISALAAGKVTVKVATANALTSAQRKEIQAIATKLAVDAKEVELAEEVDADLIAGVRMQIGSQAWDATVRNQLSNLKNQLSN